MLSKLANKLIDCALLNNEGNQVLTETLDSV